jgi:hypothetical protein
MNPPRSSVVSRNAVITATPAGVITVPPPGPGNATNNAQGQVSPTPNQQGGVLATSIPANTTVPQQIQGNSFYVIAASGTISVRPRGGQFVVYQPGTGYRLPADTSFANLEIQNNNAFPVSFALFIGFGEFIDNRLILESGIVFPVMKVTYSPTPPAVGPIVIDDISGQAFVDQNGAPWLAINRIAFIVDNLSTASNLILQNAAADGTDCGTVFPATARTFPLSGDFTLKTGAGTVNGAVQEYYNAISPNIPL